MKPRVVNRAVKRIYVVEMWNDAVWPPRFEPTVGVGLTRADGRMELRRWREDNVSDRFRLCAYARVPA